MSIDELFLWHSVLGSRTWLGGEQSSAAEFDVVISDRL